MSREKDKTIKVKLCVLNKQNASINFSIRLKDGLTKEEVIKKSVEFLKEVL